jgi:hypothetical protein
MEATRKRQRANTNGDSALPQQTDPASASSFTTSSTPQYDLSECIKILDAADNGSTIKQLPLAVAQSDPAAAALVRRRYDDHTRREQTKVINFDHYYKEFWYTINEQYRSLSGSKQYDISFDVYNEVRDIIQIIAQQAGVEHASFETKSSGLETLRKIAKTICMSCNDTLGHEMQQRFSQDTSLVDAMTNVVNALNDEECEDIGNMHDGRSTFIEDARASETCR